ncbi:hypothetical protein QAD02_020464 [Eretmocerus hayati]|uniref:Uncharacterized protein n=1 Tax=Eretmocerus hayati TaxID=131215 RepID=A0ACC2PPD7_9HYME|nr:hypothetical protein QAD02_020464 [Eretmocerus hayati]
MNDLTGEDIVLRAALILRKSIVSIEKKPLLNDLKTSSITEGECDIPKISDDFVKTMLRGDLSRHLKNERGQSRTNSISQDLLYAVMNSQIEPSKHVVLRMTLKRLTNSRRVIDIVKHYGHCSSYSTLEGNETEVTYSSPGSSDWCSPDIKRKKDLYTGVVWDNHDGLVDTINIEGTSHDTVGIIHQLVDDGSQSTDEIDDISTQLLDHETSRKNSSRPGRRRRMYEVIESELESYPKKPRLADHLFRRSSIPQFPKSSNLKSIRQTDFLLLLSHISWK